ncbi:MAG: putative hydro-lyase [Denitrovibrio sp.]|nr:MAG: putative hydro-lyase [Denitrovibrio sp.]
MKPVELRRIISKSEFIKPTAGYCNGFVQANLVVLPSEYAGDFEKFCEKNPKPCPLLEVVGPGKHHTSKIAKGADLLKDIPKYQTFIDGKPDKEISDITDLYKEDFVFFLLGCSFSFEEALMNSGIYLRHVEEKKNVSMYNTNIDLESVGIFSGKMVVSMRPIKCSRIVDAALICSKFPSVHGAPIHVGDPSQIGISDINAVDYGDSVAVLPDELPVFWPCGVTPQNVLKQAKLPFAITHSPGYMLVCDIKNEDLRID